MKRLLPCLFFCVTTSALSAEPAVSAGRYHNLALSADGAVLWWGKNQAASYLLGQKIPPTLPQRVLDLPPAIAVAAGWEHSSAITRDGAVYEWGFSPYQVRQVYLLHPFLGACVIPSVLSGGHGKDPCAGAERERAALMQVPTPMRIRGVPPAVAIAAGDKSTAIITRDGGVHCWNLRSFPQKVDGLEHIVSIALGQFHGVALRNDGVVLAWGGASGGGIAYPTGESTLCADPNPQPIFSGAVAIAASADGIYALRADGGVWAWGSGWNGDSGMPKEDNPTGKPDRYLARRIGTLEGAVQLGGGTNPSARSAQGRLAAWRRDYAAGATVMPALPGVDGIAAVSSYSSILALRRDGFVCTMGENMSGTTLPNSKEYEIKAFVPVPRDGDQGPLNLIDQARPVPEGLCANIEATRQVINAN